MACLFVSLIFHSLLASFRYMSVYMIIIIVWRSEVLTYEMFQISLTVRPLPLIALSVAVMRKVLICVIDRQ